MSSGLDKLIVTLSPTGTGFSEAYNSRPQARSVKDIVEDIELNPMSSDLTEIILTHCRK